MHPELPHLPTISTPNRKKTMSFKAIAQPSDVEKWLASSTAQDLLQFVCNVADSSRGGQVEYAYGQDLHKNKSNPVLAVVHALENLSELVKAHPPIKQPQRYGNTAFRGWLAAVESSSMQSMQQLLDIAAKKSPAPPLLENHRDVVVQELATYWKTSFGNGTRIDYGTGHEASFLMWLYCLGKLGVLDLDPTKEGHHLCDVALCLYPAYLHIARVLQRTYMLEPAGSHGVWSLDDYCFLPFLLGASQLVGHRHIRPRSIFYEETVDGFGEKFMYLSAIQFIHTVKSGPFHEHSHILSDIAKTVPSWEGVAAGLMRMFRVEVLGKFPVAQHFYFGTLLPPTWRMKEEDTTAAEDVTEVAAAPAKAPATTRPTGVLPPSTRRPSPMFRAGGVLFRGCCASFVMIRCWLRAVRRI